MDFQSSTQLDAEIKSPLHSTRLQIDKDRNSRDVDERSINVFVVLQCNRRRCKYLNSTTDIIKSVCSKMKTQELVLTDYNFVAFFGARVYRL